MESPLTTILSINYNLIPVLMLYDALRNVHADIDRRDGATNEFIIVNKGRMNQYTVLMYLEDISQGECAQYCIMHLSCRSVSYSLISRLCELNNMEFDASESDTTTNGWVNYGTPGKIDGGWSIWKESVCSRTCDEGTKKCRRICDNPKARHGGADCVGEEVVITACNEQMCPVSICYKGRRNGYGQFHASKTGKTKEVRLIHEKGNIACGKSKIIDKGKWGCDAYFKYKPFMIHITNESDFRLFPDKQVEINLNGAYNLEGIDKSQNEILIKRTKPIHVQKNQVFKIWHSEDLSKQGEGDNEGEHCVRVQFIYENQKKDNIN